MSDQYNQWNGQPGQPQQPQVAQQGPMYPEAQYPQNNGYGLDGQQPYGSNGYGQAPMQSKSKGVAVWVTIVIAVIALLAGGGAGFAIGRATAPAKEDDSVAAEQTDADAQNKNNESANGADGKGSSADSDLAGSDSKSDGSSGDQSKVGGDKYSPETYNMQISGTKVQEDGYGHQVMIVAVDWENNSDEDKSFMTTFANVDAYQNGKTLNMGMLSLDAPMYEKVSNSMTEKIQPGVKTTYYEVFTLKGDSPVTVKLFGGVPQEVVEEKTVNVK